jgi:glycosyltransferase involved in cell wall biosynthesis
MRRPRESFSHDSVKQIKASVDYLPTELILDLPRLIGPNMFFAVSHPSTYLRALQLAARRFQRTRKSATFKHLFQAGYLVQKHIAKDPSIVHLHGHFAHSPTSVTMFAAQLSGLPFSFTAHAKDIYTSHPEQLKEKMAQARFVATCTKHNKEYLESLCGTRSPEVHCIYHGIDIELFNHDGVKNFTQPPYQILTVARMTEKKGLPTIYRALKLLAERDISFNHTLIGDGDDREEILTLIRTLKLERYCSWIGTQTHAEVLEHFRHSDLFILGCEIARNGDRDGIPNVLVESLAMGIPAISTNVSALPEILINQKTGLTVAPGDHQAFADAIMRLLSDFELREKIITGGRAFVRQHFDNRRLISDLASIFSTKTPSLTISARTD